MSLIIKNHKIGCGFLHPTCLYLFIIFAYKSAYRTPTEKIHTGVVQVSRAQMSELPSWVFGMLQTGDGPVHTNTSSQFTIPPSQWRFHSYDQTLSLVHTFKRIHPHSRTPTHTLVYGQDGSCAYATHAHRHTDGRTTHWSCYPAR